MKTKKINVVVDGRIVSDDMAMIYGGIIPSCSIENPYIKGDPCFGKWITGGGCDTHIPTPCSVENPYI